MVIDKLKAWIKSIKMQNVYETLKIIISRNILFNDRKFIYLIFI